MAAVVKSLTSAEPATADEIAEVKSAEAASQAAIKARRVSTLLTGRHTVRRPRASSRCRGTSRHGNARSRSLLPRLPDPRRPLRRPRVRRRDVDRHLLPADLPGAHARSSRTAASSPRPPPRRRRASAPACAAGRRSRPTSPSGAARPTRCRRALALIADGALDGERGRRRGAGRAAGRRRPPAAPAVPAASRRLAHRRRPDAARAVRQAADPRHAPADDRGGVGLGLRQRAPLQRDLPRAVRPAAQRAAPPRKKGGGADNSARDGVTLRLAYRAAL